MIFAVWLQPFVFRVCYGLDHESCGSHVWLLSLFVMPQTVANISLFGSEILLWIEIIVEKFFYKSKSLSAKNSYH